MLESLVFHALDIVTNPVIITEPDGTLLYKNEEAEKRLQVPHVKRKITKHLRKNDREIIKNFRDTLPAFLEYESEGNYLPAFVDTVYYESRPVLLFLFSHLFQFSFMEHTKLLQPSAIAEKLSGNKILSIARDAYTREDLPIALRNRQGHIVATRVFQKLFSTILTELYYGGESLLYPLNYANEIMAYASRKILTKFGLDVLFPALDIEKSTLLIDFKPFSLLLSHLLILLAEVTVSPTASICITEEENTVLYAISAEIKADDRRIFIGGTEAFSHILPGCALDLYLFDTLCQNQKFRFDFTLKDCEENNLTLRLRAPIERKYVVSERIERDRAMLFAIIDRYAALLEK